MVSFTHVVALLDDAEVKLSSKAKLAPLDILKIHKDLLNALQYVSESVILKRQVKILSTGNQKGKKWVTHQARIPSQTILNPVLIRPKCLRQCL